MPPPAITNHTTKDKTPGFDASSKNRANSVFEVEGQFADALRAAGFRLSGPPIMDGKWQRCAVEGDKGRKQSGRYRGYLDGRPAGYIQNFRDETRSGNWKANSAERPTLSEADRANARRIMEAAAEAKERQRAERLEAIAETAAEAWAAAIPAPPLHPYLARKGVSGDGLKMRNGRLLVPMFDFAGDLRGLQTIDYSGGKLFPKDGTTAELHLPMGTVRDGEWLLISEGWATGRTLHEATGYAVAVAFNKGNYTAIARAYQARYPGLRVAFCGDDDRHLPLRNPPMPNVGKVAAETAARETGGVAILPPFAPEEAGTDWNDYAAVHGQEALRSAILAQLAAAVPVPIWPHFPRPHMSGAAAEKRLQRFARVFFDQLERCLAARDWIEAEVARLLPDLLPGIEARLIAKLREEGMDGDEAAEQAAERAPRVAAGIAKRQARRQAARMAEFGRKAAHGEMPRFQVKGAAGLGKSTIIAREYARRPSLWRRNIYVYIPTLQLCDDFACDVAREIEAAQQDGIASVAPDGSRPRTVTIQGRMARGMCVDDRRKVVEAAQKAEVGSIYSTCCHTPAVGNIPASSCPFFDVCGYIAQFDDKGPALRIMPHVRVGLHSPEKLRLPEPDLVVVDESAIDALTFHTLLDPALLADPKSYDSEPGEEDRIQEAMDTGARVVEALRAGGDAVAAMKAAGCTMEHLRDAAKAARLAEEKARPKVHAGMEAGRAVDALAWYKKHKGKLVAGVLAQLARDITTGRTASLGVEWDSNHEATTEDGGKVVAPMIRHHGIKPATQAPAGVALLLPDADADLQINRRLYGAHRRGADLRGVTVRAARQAFVVQVSDHVLAKSSLAPDENKLPNNVRKAEVLRGKITEMVRRMTAGGNRVLVGAAKDVREELTGQGCDGIPHETWQGAEITHFGRHLGVNRWTDFGAVAVIGREQLPPIEAERIARAIYADDAGATLELPGKYVEELRRHDLRDGIAPPVKVWVHPDKRVQAIVELSREQALGQMIDRLRPVRRAVDRPAHVVVVSNLPVPGLTVDRLLSLDDVLAGGTVWDRAIARCGNVLPLMPEWLAENLPDLFESARTARREVAFLKKNPLVFSDLSLNRGGGDRRPNGNRYIYCQMATCLFRKSPKNAQHSNVLVVNRGQSGDSLLQIRAELAGLVGDEVADFRMFESVQATVIEAEPQAEPVSVAVRGMDFVVTGSVITMPEPMRVEPVPEPVSAVVGGASFIATAEIIALPQPVRGRRRAMWVDSPLRDFMLAVPVQMAATG